MSWAAIAAAVIGAGATAGVAAASAPNYPNPAASSRRTVLAQLRALPGQRIVEAMARLGLAGEYPTGKIKPKFVDKPVAQALKDGDITQAQYDRFVSPSRVHPQATVRVAVPGGGTPETQHVDFTGLSDADIQSALARQQAQTQLDLSQKYGPQFIAAARQQEQLANPEGTAARGLLASEINRLETQRQGQAHPVADTLGTQVLADLQAGRGTTPDVNAAIDQVVAQRNAAGAGGTGTAADIENELANGPQGQQRLQQRIAEGTKYLASGATPEDIDYRRRQQSLANMANFLAGRTPTAQFRTLSGGQQGPAPMAAGPSLPNLNPNGQQLANQAGVTGVNLGAQNNQNNVGGWFAGLSALTRGLNVAGSAGWKPFAG